MKTAYGKGEADGRGGRNDKAEPFKEWLVKRVFMQKLRDRGLKTKQGAHNQTYWEDLAIAEVVDTESESERFGQVNQVNRVDEKSIHPVELFHNAHS